MNLHGPKVVVCGAGGFIGGHLVKDLLSRGVHVIRAIDLKPLEDWYQIADGVENLDGERRVHEARETAPPTQAG